MSIFQIDDGIITTFSRPSPKPQVTGVTAHFHLRSCYITPVMFKTLYFTLYEVYIPLCVRLEKIYEQEHATAARAPKPSSFPVFPCWS